MTEHISGGPKAGKDKPGGRLRTYRDRRVADYRPPTPPDSLWSNMMTAPNTEQADSSIQTPQTETQEREHDPFLLDLPEGAVLSSGRFKQPGILRQGAPANSAFRIFSKATPTVDGEVVSRYGKLYLKQPDGTLIDPPQELALLNHVNTRKRRVLPANFKNADSAPIIPNLEKETFIF